ncbi:histone-like nucleoid-structuring protein Lsr2 [Spirillospora sp. CA-128828]|uniref:histone-like nucleoid-structuring protein Lsr2 n=1 Tax=Spirillospora sp. CA-128828 TaxID=3240033 RepID=UPI003D917AF0
MAQQVRVTMTDDLDGSEASETVSFAVDGREYEIDLNEKNASELRSSLHAYMESGRRLKGTRRGKASSHKGASSRERSAEIREWAKNHGIKVSDRGRIPVNVIEQYEAAH